MSCSYAYTAINLSGEKTSGFLTAKNKTDLLERLLEEDLFLLGARRKTAVQKFWNWPGSQEDWALLERLSTTMVILLHARMSLAESLAVVVATSDRQLARVGEGLLQRISSGQTLSQASGADPAVFGRLYPMLFTVGEATGDMHGVFVELLESARWHRQLKTRIHALLTYPVMVLLVMSAVFLFLLLSVVPQLVTFVQSVNQQLPWHTLALFSLSRAAQHYWLTGIITLLTGAGCLLILARCSNRVRTFLDSATLATPFFGTLLVRLKLARFFHCMAMLSRSQLDLLLMLKTAQPLLHSATLEKAVGQVVDDVNSGTLLAQAMRESNVFPEMVWRMVRVGEQSGELAGIFQHISDLYDGEVNKKINSIEQFLPPLLILQVGLMLMWMIVSVMGPLYDTVISAGAGLL